MAKKNKSHDMAQSIIDALKDGTAPWIKPWTPDNSVVPHNPVTGTRYKGVNFLYLSMQGKPDPRWVTFKQAQRKEWQVKKGSKGTTVQFWQFEKDKKTINDEGKTVTERVKLERPLLRHYYVFNASDIEGMPELTHDSKVNNEWERHERAENVLKNSNAEIEHVSGDIAAYYPTQDMIKMPPKGQFDTPDKYYATALHELGHWTGHESRLDRPLSNVFGSKDYAREELRAEIASYMVGMQLGIGHDPGQHLAYVDSWIKDLEDHPTEIFKASSDAEKIQTFVMDFEQEQKQEQVKEGIVENISNENSKNLQDDEIKAMPAMPESQVNELTGKRFISYYANQELDAVGNINLELQQALQRGTTVGVLRFENALSKTLTEKAHINMEELKQAGIDGVILTKNGKPVSAIATDEQQFHKGMYQAAKGLEKSYLTVPYADKDQAKKHGALWDKPAKSWFIPVGLESKPFAKWKNGQSITADNPQQQFADFIQEMGGDLQGESPTMDGKLHRIPELGAKPGNKNVSYVGHLDGIPAGYVKNFRGGEKNWKMSGIVLTDEDRTRLKKEGQEKKAQREKARETRYSIKANESKNITDKLTPATGKEAYFADKGISINNPNVKIDAEKNIVVSLQDIDGKQWSHQTLQRSGFKQIFKDSRLQGTFALIGAKSVQDIKGDYNLVEGYSTGATVHEATGKPVIVCTSSNNLKHVALALHDRQPSRDLYILADDDRHLVDQDKVNTGIVKAKEAAMAVDGHVISPDFSGAKPDKARTDFNDMAKVRGKDAVQDHIKAKIDLARSGKNIENEKIREEKKENIKKTVSVER